LKTAESCKKKLQSILHPHFLQRLKENELKHVLTTKKELVVWTHLSTLQRKMYENYLVDGGTVAALLSGESKSPLEAISWLKKLCAHPCLVNGNMLQVCNDEKELLDQSAKLQVLVSLITRLNQSGHRFLVFSQSTKMLDIIERVVPFSLARIDGKTKNRQNIVDCFNKQDSTFDGMLLSTKAAGVGLTLTGADRAIIFDPSWNPADDSQAVDRCYRIGQSRNVTIYRLISAGTVEGKEVYAQLRISTIYIQILIRTLLERMYEKQVYKDGIRRTVITSDESMARYFSRDEMANAFRLMPAGECLMMQRLRQDPDTVVGGSGKKSILENHSQVIGITSHDALY
jgi:SNF2 family DNA or RNA helicase